MILRLATFAFLFMSTFGLTQSAAAQSLPEISAFAEDICGDIPTGSYTKTEIEGKVKADFGLLAKIIDPNVELDANRLSEIYEGIPFDKLPAEIPTVSMCKSELVRVILERKEARANTCRHADFGQVGWNRTERFSDSSGRIGGGNDQKWWCNQVVAEFLRTRSIGSDYDWKKVDSSEESDKDWKGHVTYKYHCTVEVSWDPLYAEKADAGRCGITYY